MRKFLAVAAVLALVLVLAVPASAASGGKIWFNDTDVFVFGTNCADFWVWHRLQVTADTDDDGGGHDYVAIVAVDALGRPIDTDYWGFPAGDALDWNSIDPGMIFYEIAARPITAALFDIPYPFGNGGGPSENTLKSFDWILANGTLMDEVVFDPAYAVPDGCAGVPLMDAYTFKHVPAEVMLGWPEDGRLNEHPGAPIAIYAVDDGVFEVWGIDVNTGMGMLAFTADTTALVAGDVPIVGAEALNPYTFQPITMYLLPSEEFQINTYYGFGKPYIVTWPMDSTEPGDLYVQDW
jgi:hypothetical protein